MKEKNCDYEYLAAGGALYALEPHEDAALAEHLPHCSRCRELLASSREVATHIGSGLPQEDPPPELRTRIMELAANTPQITPKERAGTPRSVEVLEEGPASPKVTPLDEVRRRRSRTRMLVAAALVVFLGVTGVLGVRVLQLSQERDTQIAEAGRTSQMLRSVSDPNAKMTVLRANGQRAATLVASDKGAVLMPASLAPNDRAHVYVVWATDGAKAKALSTFDVAKNGDGPLSLRWSPDSSRHATYAVSLEKGRTAPELPSKVLASGAAT